MQFVPMLKREFLSRKYNLNNDFKYRTINQKIIQVYCTWYFYRSVSLISSLVHIGMHSMIRAIYLYLFRLSYQSTASKESIVFLRFHGLENPWNIASKDFSMLNILFHSFRSSNPRCPCACNSSACTSSVTSKEYSFRNLEVLIFVLRFVCIKLNLWKVHDC